MSSATKIVLASSSIIRAKLLKAAGIKFCIDAPNIDENKTTLHLKTEASPIPEIAKTLSEMKALFVSARWTDHLVVGADQTLDMGGQLFHKPKNMVEAKKRLIALRGNIHRLTSAVSVAYNRKVLWSYTAVSTLKMHSLSDSAIDEYLSNAGTDILRTVGGYEIEKLGIQLFEEVKGDYFAILGLPLIPLLNFFRDGDRVLLFDH